jgi:hypothetical protein
LQHLTSQEGMILFSMDYINFKDIPADLYEAARPKHRMMSKSNKPSQKLDAIIAF